MSCGMRNPQCIGSPGCREGACRGGAYNCTGIFLGNSIFAPVIGSPSIQSLPMLRGVQHCLELLEAQEAARGGLRYERVVFSRLEFWWLRPHPPLRLLDPSIVWLPSGEDYYGGVNDRHAVLNRSAAEVYLGRWRAILSGDVLRWYPRLTRSDESYVLALLQFHQLPISRFPSVAALGCCSGRCFQSACYKRAFPLRGAVGELLRQTALLGGETAAASEAAAEALGFPNGFGLGQKAIPGSVRLKALEFDNAQVDSITHTLEQPSSAAGSCNRSSSRLQLTSLLADQRRAAAANVSAIIVPAKYRPELELAVQHAVALRLPGAAYRLVPGLRAGGQPSTTCVPWNRLTPAQLRQYHTRPASTVGQHHGRAANCSLVVVAAAGAHAAPFAAVMRSLQFAGFRKAYLESWYLTWNL